MILVVVATHTIITFGTCSVEIDEKDPHHVVGDLDLSEEELTALPESFGSLKVAEDGADDEAEVFPHPGDEERYGGVLFLLVALVVTALCS